MMYETLSTFVSIRSAFWIGLIAGILVFFWVLFVDAKLKIDDPVGAISVHFVKVFGEHWLWAYSALVYKINCVIILCYLRLVQNRNYSVVGV
ncbi:hypothetical protein [Brasilonema sp. UFV-L1]|uniref:hypothetical protein n=1 Tax=Brasilonema sp. UFV-L1 TaxID=2234130 RepID=UPI00403F7855